MLTRDDLIRIAKLHNLRPWQQEKHYIQNLILLSLSEYPLTFKGSTYLWFYHGLNRFSEALDFTATGNLSTSIGERVSSDLALFGIQNNLKVMKSLSGSISFRISAKGPLHSSDADLCHVYVEISTREKIICPPVSKQIDFDPYSLPLKIISGMNLSEVAAEKIRAILTRNQARDVYDLYFLIKKKNVQTSISIIDEKLSYYQTKFLSDEFLLKVKQKKSLWKKELEGMIFGELPEFDSTSQMILDWEKSLK